MASKDVDRSGGGTRAFQCLASSPRVAEDKTGEHSKPGGIQSSKVVWQLSSVSQPDILILSVALEVKVRVGESRRKKRASQKCVIGGVTCIRLHLKHSRLPTLQHDMSTSDTKKILVLHR